MESEKYHPVPQPDEVSKRERDDAMGAYLMMFAALAAGLPLPMLNLIASVIYYSVNKNKGRFVKFHCLQSLWSQLPTTALNIGLISWTIRNLIADDGYFSDTYKGYLAMVLIVNLLYFVFSIVGAVRARQGRMYYFLFFGRLSYQSAFAIREGSESGTVTRENRPPR